MNSSLEDQLLDIRRSLMAMAAVVDERLKVVFRCLDENDFAGAQPVRHGDRDIDERELAIEAKCIETLARHAPVAGDLRLVLATLRITAELERLGDLAKSTAKRLLHMNSHGFLTTPEVLRRMTQSVATMVSQTFDALAGPDAGAARVVRAGDAQIDEFQRIVMDWTQNELIRHGGDTTEAAVDLLTIARNLERIGDMCTNIAEDIIFLVDGEVVRHTRA